MADFKISASPGGSQTAAGAAYDDLVPGVDVSVGSSDNANVTYTNAVFRGVMDRVRPTLDAIKTPPLASAIGSTWSWVNQGSAAAAQDSTTGELLLTSPRTGTDNWAMLVRTLPSTPFTATVEFEWDAPPTSATAFALVYRDSSSSKFITNQIYSDPTNYGNMLAINAFNWTNSTTFSAQNSSLFSNSGGFALPVFPRWLRWTDNGTTNTVYCSWNGVNFTQLGSGQTRTTFLTANQIGFALNTKGTDLQLTPALRMRVRDFYIT